MKKLFVILAGVIILGCVRKVPTSRKNMYLTPYGVIHKSQIKDIKQWKKKYKKQSGLFYLQDSNVFHVSTKIDTTLLDWGDLRILQIDSLQDYYLQFRTETE